MIEDDRLALDHLFARVGARAHIVGIAGAGTAPLAILLADQGWRVSGCDRTRTATTEILEARGILVSGGHDAAHVDGVDIVIATSAARDDVPDVSAARARSIPVVKRAAALGALTRRKRTICVAGTAGKTTTTAMVAAAMIGAGLDPSAMIGSDVPGMTLGARAGASEWFVVEADEFDRSFLQLTPDIAIVTNVEADHLDYYGSLDEIEAAFRAFLCLVPASRVIACADDAGARRVAPEGATLYGTSDESDWRVRSIDLTDDGGSSTRLTVAGRDLQLRLRMPGRHNAMNGVAALAAAVTAGADPSAASDALAEFAGARRRFELIGRARGVSVYDDYAHHPTKVRACLAAARQVARGRVFCLFQPHTYHRTASLFDDFAKSFSGADRALLLDIYSPVGRETPIVGVDSARLADAARQSGVAYCDSPAHAIAILASECRDGDVVVTMGAGDVTLLAPAIVDALAAA
ncbi:MAG: UDP-N-acetylmuramate--L-alanine ligase [Chloroflexota bacterium]|nr:MAG: UDP-N-acetylmuramate--L-alanine ligase [Chloroflexota bacterium]